MMVILVSGMGLIPKEYYEAGEVFGANGWQRFIKITLPMLRPAIFVALMVTRAVPGVALSLPVFIIFGRIGIIDTHFGMILVYVALNVPFTIWLIDGFFRQVPKELAEAAEIDGCTRWQGTDSSLKFCLIAEGKADIYPRFGPTNEWDTAAGQGVLEAAGGEVVTTDGRPLLYGKPRFSNPHFIARSKAAR